jgi:5'-nucleotidase/UDP-sugar diphosphatase
MARWAFLIKETRRTHPTILVDGGDFHWRNPTAHQDIKDRYFYRGMSLLGYDAVAIGEFETAAKLQSPFDTLKQYRLPFLSTNILKAATRRPIAAQEIVKTFGGRRTLFGRAGGWRVGIFSVAAPSIINTYGDNPAGTYYVVDPKIAATEAVAKLRAEGCSLIVAISHQTWEQSLTLADKVPGIDLVINSHRIHGPSYAEAVGKTLIVDPGEPNWYFTEVEFTFGPGGAAPEMKDRCRELAEKTKGDPKLLALEHSYIMEMDKFRTRRPASDTTVVRDTTWER